MSSLRSERARRRAIHQRNQRITIAVVAVLILAVIGVMAYSSLNRGKATSSPLDTSGMTTIASGLQYKDLVVGKGQEAKPGDAVSVHYTGWLTDGTKFDSSVDRGQPFEFTIGIGQVIQGWDEGVAGMKVGGKRKLLIPPALGYGVSGAGNTIPPNATLIFDVELLAISQ